MADPQREMKDMEGLMDDLQVVFDDLYPVVRKEFTDKIQAVLEEWSTHTRPCIEEMCEQNEEWQ